MKTKLLRCLMGALFVAVSVIGAAAQTNACLVDDHSRPLPGQPPAGWYYNSTGGDRGLLSDINSDPNGCAEYVRASSSSYQATVKRLVGSALWEYAGMWYAISHPLTVKQTYVPTAMYSAAILTAYQPKLVGMQVVVNGIQSPAGRSDLSFKVEIKGFDGGSEAERFSQSWSGSEIQGSYPKTFTATWDPATLGSVSFVTWLLDMAMPGDSIEVDRVSLLVEMPALDRRGESFVTSLAMLLDNYDPTSGMVGDRSGFPARDFENVTATAKLGKLLAFGVKAGVCDAAQSTAIVTNIARVLLEVVPVGPAGKDALWPHFTKNWGMEAASGSEWASGDTAYALLDLCVALQMIGDPANQLNHALAHLAAIRWDLLRTADGGFSHGYDTNGVMSVNAWKGFGMEYIGVAMAALAGRNVPGTMGPLPTDNGSGFIMHAGYPLVPCGVDRWTNDWPQLRYEDARAQIGWYSSVSNLNPYLTQQGLFGLSAAERPEGYHTNSAEIYQAYGIGGRYSPPNDGSNNIVVLHYSAMAADLQRGAAEQMWGRLKSMGIISPLNNMESMAVNPDTGTIEEINYLKGSWNLALQAEGWAWTYPEVARAAYKAVESIPALAAAWRTLFPPVVIAERPVVADFDGDRLADPALVTSNGWHVWFSRGSYARQGPFALTCADAVPLAADFDGDRLADPAMARNTGMTVWLSGAGYAGITTEDILIPGAAALGGDLDGDAKADPATYTLGGWTAWLSRSGYATSGPYEFVRTNAAALMGDFDGDRLADPALVTSSGWTIWMSSACYADSGPYLFMAPGGTPVTADFDGDGKADPAMYKNGVWTIWLSSLQYAAIDWDAAE